MAEENITDSAFQGLKFFLMTTLIYFIIKSTTTSEKTKTMWTIIYLLATIVGEYFINLSLTNKQCGSNQYSTAIIVTVIPWGVIFGMINLLLIVFPGWLAPFSNTFGYLTTSLGGIDNFFRDLLVPEISTTNSDYKLTSRVLMEMRAKPSLIINEVNSANIDSFWEKMTAKQSSYFVETANTPENFDKFKYFINLKDDVARALWFILTGVLITSVSFNYIVNAGCKKSEQEMKESETDIQQKQVEEKSNVEGASAPIIYTSYEGN